VLKLIFFVTISASAVASAHAGETREASGPIIVTASRIPSSEPLDPAVSMEGDRIRQRNLTNLADALNETPGFRGSVTPDGVQENFGQGVNFLNIFGLGSQRTLTLVNGRRVVTSNVPTLFGQAAPGGQVDLNMIPTILVKRVERVSVGGAPVYGSDAIAGTVNVLLRDDLDGLEAAGTSGITGKGDNFRHNLSSAYGTDFAGGRGHLVLAASYDKVRGVRQDARGFYRDDVTEVPNTGGLQGRLNPAIGPDTGPGDGIPGSVLVRDVRLPFLTTGGLVLGLPGEPLGFSPSGDLVPLDTGSPFGPFSSGGDGLRLSDYGQITSNLARLSLNLLGHYDLSDRVQLFAEAQYFRSRADELVDQPNYNAVLFTGVSGPLLFSAANPFLSPQAQQTLLGRGAPLFFLSRANADIGDPTGYAVSKVMRGVLGLRGDFDLASKPFTFELAASYGRSDFADHDQQIDQQRFVNAINVTRDANGGIVCDAAPLWPAGGMPVADPTCRPLNLFGAGAPSREALDYVLADVTTRSRMEQFVLSGNVGGSPFMLLGNDVSINLGFEHRSEKARFLPDAFTRAGLGRSTPVAPVSGGYRLDEIFGEILLPLIGPANRAPIHALELFARGRYSRNSVNGAFAAWTGGARLAPVEAIKLRGNFTRSFRSPAVAELFSPLSPSREFVPDLCSTSNRNSGPNPAIRARNCAAFLAAYPLATPLIASFVNVPGLVGGNPGLANERADSFTFGTVLEPLPALRLSVDWIDIRIKRPIALLSVADIASACFDNPDFDLSDPARGNAYCAAIGRDATGQVLADPLDPQVRSTFVNGRKMRFSGLQASLSWLAKLGAGTLSVGADLFHVHRRSRNITGIQTERTDGLIGDPAWQGQLRIGYAQARWGVATQVNYTGRQLFGRTDRSSGPNDTREIDHLKPFATLDANIFALPLDGLRVNLAVTNLTNRQGQRYHGFLIPVSINDPLGRRFSLSVAKAF
jgi:outer membrane receptor protein involved in Fe transport